MERQKRRTDGSLYSSEPISMRGDSRRYGISRNRAVDYLSIRKVRSKLQSYSDTVTSFRKSGEVDDSCLGDTGM